ncbi:MAG: anaerobic ribonucleoside triphosphate reductase [Clostridia bacterium]|jgi:anaerobic ribonucleoside-triphosphate reductase|nr:anaerobic ribonucleoside triphosphate reductase [Clostridia bacterium]
MYIEVPEKVMKKVVVKRDGKKVEFNGAKIALAIQKGFSDVINERYNQTDVNHVYSKVLTRIAKTDGEKIKIEEIQDLIEEELKNNGYQDVYEAFSNYREKRAQSRQLFFDEKKQHKFLKALENLGLKSANIEESKEETALETMLQYGSTISNQFAVTYLMKKKFSGAHENGDIYIDNMEFVPMGTTNCCQIDIQKLYEEKLSTENSLLAYISLMLIAIEETKKEEHGGQGIAAFDYILALAILKTFKVELKELIFNYLELTDFDKFIAVNGIEREIEKISSIEVESSIFDKYCRESEELKRLFKIACKKAKQKTEELTYQAMQYFVDHFKEEKYKTSISINLGTDTSLEGRMVTRNFLKVIGEDIVPLLVCVFKVKEGINYEQKDLNYDLLELACETVAKQKTKLHFSFLDAEFNQKFYNKEDYRTQVAYMNYQTRVLDNIVDTNKAVTIGRGNLSCTTINLPRLGIKHGNISNSKVSLDDFFRELEEMLELVKDQLLERFELQCKKRASNFPFLLGQNLWIDSEKIKPEDNLKKVLKQGTLTIRFIGLAECLKALIGKHHAEEKRAEDLGIKIVSFMRKKCDEYSEKYNLNFTLEAASTQKASKEFIKMDQAIFGKLKGITDKQNYTSSFMIPDGYKISVQKKIDIEAKYHKLTNGGHFTYVETNKDKSSILKVVSMMKEAQIGYGAII